MDRLIKRFDFIENGDLRSCPERGVAYQTDMSVIAPYEKEYFEKCLAYKGNEISTKVNSGRSALVRKYCDEIIDIGAGTGEFIERFISDGGKAKGYDANPYTVEWLRNNNHFSEEFGNFNGFTFWDTIEHVKIPEFYFKRIPKESYLFVSIPVFKSLSDIRKSKHYRPNEHLYYWTEEGFVEWMKMYGFRLLEKNDSESEAGRDGIKEFVFKKDIPDYHDYVNMYHDIHSSRYYGASAKLYLGYFSEPVFWLNPASILDYGCGRSDLVSYFWKDGGRDLARYDPAIPEYKDMPTGKWDLVFCCDVMEHIPIKEVDRVFSEIKEKSQRVIFVISTKLARAKLPNGENAHISLLTKSEWTRWIEDYFGKSSIIKTKWDHVLMVKTF